MKEKKQSQPISLSSRIVHPILKSLLFHQRLGTDTLKLLDNAKEQLLGEHKSYNVDYAHGDTVWFTFDTDLNEKEGKITPLRAFCNSMNAEIKSADNVKPYIAWNVAESNPSFEVWLYYH